MNMLENLQAAMRELQKDFRVRSDNPDKTAEYSAAVEQAIDHIVRYNVKAWLLGEDK